MSEAFNFELVIPERRLVRAPAREVVVPGREGHFTVLKGHAPVLATLRAGILEALLDNGDRRRFFVRGGFADTGLEALTVLAEQAIPVETLNAEKLAQEVKNAEEDVADAKDEATRAEAQSRLDEVREVVEALRFEGIG